MNVKILLINQNIKGYWLCFADIRWQVIKHSAFVWLLLTRNFAAQCDHMVVFGCLSSEHRVSPCLALSYEKFEGCALKCSEIWTREGQRKSKRVITILQCGDNLVICYALQDHNVEILPPYFIIHCPVLLYCSLL